MITCLKQLSFLCGAESGLSKIDYWNDKTLRVPVLLAKYNEDVVYKLPPISRYLRQTTAKLMVGMDKKLTRTPRVRRRLQISQTLWI